MISIGRSAAAGNFTINFCTPGFCMFQFFQHQYTGSFTHYKSIPVFIIRAAGCFRIIISFTHCFHGIKTAYTGFADHRFTATG